MSLQRTQEYLDKNGFLEMPPPPFTGKRICLVLPYLEKVEYKAVLAALEMGSNEKYTVVVKPAPSSLLANGLNEQWVAALNSAIPFDYFGIIHADVFPMARGWIDTLISDMEEGGYDAMHGVVAIKDARGCLSTALGHKGNEWAPVRRITLAEAATLPLTFGIDDCRKLLDWGQSPWNPEHACLLCNTGVFMLKLGDWKWSFPGFTIKDRIVWIDPGGTIHPAQDNSVRMKSCGKNPEGKEEFRPDGIGCAQAVPEDWGLGRWMALNGLKVGGCRKFPVEHYAQASWSTETVWGLWQTDEHFFGQKLKTKTYTREEVGHFYNPDKTNEDVRAVAKVIPDIAPDTKLCKPNGLPADPKDWGENIVPTTGHFNQNKIVKPSVKGVEHTFGESVELPAANEEAAPYQPLQHFYHRIQGWFDFQDVYRGIVSMADDGDEIVEVGTWLGKSMAFLAVEVANSGKQLKLHAVDHFAGDNSDPTFDLHLILAKQIGNPIQEQWKANMRNGGVRDRITLHHKESTLAAQEFDDASVRFVYLDGSHNYEDVLADIEAWLPKVKAGGILAGHDYNQPEVAKAVIEMFGHDFEVHQSSWIHGVKENAVHTDSSARTAGRKMGVLQGAGA